MSEPAEQHLPVGRTARYYTLGDAGPATRDVWFVLHGHGQLARFFLRPFAAVANAARLIVAPEALNRFYHENAGAHGPDARVGATWMTREDRLAEITDYVAYLDRLYERVMGALPAAEVRVTALGFSQGVATACRWACPGGGGGRSRLDRLVLWAGALPAELSGEADRAALARLAVVRVLGARDPLATPDTIAGDDARFRALGVEAPLLRFDGGHEIHAGILSELAG